MLEDDKTIQADEVEAVSDMDTSRDGQLLDQVVEYSEEDLSGDLSNSEDLQDRDHPFNLQLGLLNEGDLTNDSESESDSEGEHL